MCDEETLVGNNGRTLGWKPVKKVVLTPSSRMFPPLLPHILEGDKTFHLPSLKCFHQPPCVGVGQFSNQTCLILCHDKQYCNIAPILTTPWLEINILLQRLRTYKNYYLNTSFYKRPETWSTKWRQKQEDDKNQGDKNKGEKNWWRDKNLKGKVWKVGKVEK